ncbi:hypothetical protein M426DRAFT_262730, partial [Hypoxylon sp. CI-4A]
LLHLLLFLLFFLLFFLLLLLPLLPLPPLLLSHNLPSLLLTRPRPPMRMMQISTNASVRGAIAAQPRGGVAALQLALANAPAPRVGPVVLAPQLDVAAFQTQRRRRLDPDQPPLVVVVPRRLRGRVLALAVRAGAGRRRRRRRVRHGGW